MRIKGEWKTKRVWINKIELYPDHSQKVINHSPDGFNWGYGGSGPAQFALAILLTKLTCNEAIMIYQQFKWDFIAALPQWDFDVEFDLMDWLRLQNISDLIQEDEDEEI